MGRKATCHDYSALADTILIRKRSKGEQVFLVASAARSDGKTTTAINLAKCLARSGQQTLLMDLDFVKPEIGEILGVSPQTSASNPEIPQPVQCEDNLWVLAATTGESEKLKRIFLGSDQGKELIRVFKSEFDVLILDTTSSHNNVYADYLGDLCDGVVIVAKAYHTTPSEVVTLARKVAPAAPVGVVLNQRKEYVPRLLRKLFIGS